MKDYGHGTLICKCGQEIARCRCMENHKQIVVDFPCWLCEAKQKAAEQKVAGR